MGKIASGSYTGTAAAINISIGWIPDRVHVINYTDGDVDWTWQNGFGAGDAFQTLNHASAQNSVITSNGIDTYAGSATAAPGFTVGTSLSESAKVFYWTAWANDDGST